MRPGGYSCLFPNESRPTHHLVFFAVILLVVVLAIYQCALVLSSACAQRRRVGLWIRRRSPAACKTRRKDSVSRFAICSNPSSLIVRELPSPFDTKPKYRLEISDRIWRALYQPLGPLVRRVADKVAWLQQGRIATYLLYSFVTLVVLLALML